jgi:hypothetical protein
MSERNTTLALLAATISVVAGCSNSPDGYDQPPDANQPPVISVITSKTADQDTTVGPIEFRVADHETDASQLALSAAADGTSVFPADGVVLAGSGTTRTLTLTPLEAATGTATITVTAADPQGAASSRSFTVAVNARGASLRDAALSTFAKGEADEATVLNGLTFAQDAEDPAIFEPLIGAQ